jgi:hypothetical protein
MEQAIQACSALFETPFFVSQSILDWLHEQDVALAFQKAVTKNVPPGVNLLKDSSKLHAPTIRRLLNSYQILTDYIRSRDTKGRRALVVLNHHKGRQRLSIDRSSLAFKIRKLASWREDRCVNREMYYDGNIIPTHLRFGSYLYYRGLVSYEMLCDALQWQRERRPLMGQIAMKCGFLSPQDFAQVLFYVRVGDSFGTVARRHNKLSDAQVAKIAAIQNKYNCRIGSYFVEAGLLSKDVVERNYHHFQSHNNQHGVMAA